jgi:hypothetical protein
MNPPSSHVDSTTQTLEAVAGRAEDLADYLAQLASDSRSSQLSFATVKAFRIWAELRLLVRRPR